MTGLEDDTSGTCTPPDPRTSDDSAALCASRAKREQILTGAGRIFLAAGYEGSSMSQIAREAGVSKGTLYNHFDSKASLFSVFFEEQSVNKLATIMAITEENGQDFRTALIRLAKSAIQMMLHPTSLGLYRIIVAEAHQFPSLADTFWHYGFNRVRNSLSNWFARQTAQGAARIDDPDLVAEQFMTMCQTRIVQRTRLMLPVEQDSAAIEAIAVFTADCMVKLYGTSHQ